MASNRSHLYLNFKYENGLNYFCRAPKVSSWAGAVISVLSRPSLGPLGQGLTWQTHIYIRPAKRLKSVLFYILITNFTFH